MATVTVNSITINSAYAGIYNGPFYNKRTI